MSDISTQLFSASVSGLGIGAQVPVPANTLKNQSNRVMLLDELRFEVIAAGAGIIAQPAIGIPVAAKFQFGRFAIAPDFIPLTLFCKPSDRVCGGLYNSVNGLCEVGSFVWKLKKPLVMKQNDSLSMTLAYPVPDGLAAYSNGGALAVNTTYRDGLAPYIVKVTGVGRMVDQAPAQQFVPFLSAFVPPFLKVWGNTVDNTVESPAGSLFNPNAEPLLVTDLLGQCVARPMHGNPPSMTGLNGLVDIIDTLAAGVSIMATTIQIINSGDQNTGPDNENFGVRDYLPFPHVFHPQTRSWSFKATLNPKAYLQVRERISSPGSYITSKVNISLTDNVVVDYVSFRVGMIGYYRVSGALQNLMGNNT